LIILDKPTINIVYERDKEGNLHRINVLDEHIISSLNPQTERMIKLMVRDELPEEEILQLIEGLTEKTEALKFYNSIKRR
jgi:hypothetical protein